MLKKIFPPLDQTLTQQFIQKAIVNPLNDQSCCDLHPGVGCNTKMIYQFAGTCKNLYKTYLLVHVIPFIIFKRKKMLKQPVKQLKGLVKGFIKSLLFVGFYAVIVKRTVCFINKYYKNSKISPVIGGSLGGVSLIFQSPGRQAQIALYCVNKTIETAYNILKRRNYPVDIIPNGQCLVIGLAVGIICYLWVDCHKAFHSKYSKVLQILIGSI